MNAELYEWEKIKSDFSFPNPLRVLRCAPHSQDKNTGKWKGNIFTNLPAYKTPLSI
jgi:hypothetical protein